MVMKDLIKQLVRESLDENSKSDPASLAALEKEGKKFFPQMRLVPANADQPQKTQVAVEIPEQDRTVSLGGFEQEIAAAKVVKIEDWLNQKNIPYKKSKTTSSIYVRGLKEIIRISNHRKGSHDGPDFLVRWSTSLLEILNAIYDLVKVH
jgi:hypothetical protein